MSKILNLILKIFVLLLCCTSCQKTESRGTHSLTLNFQEGDLPSLHPHELMIYLRGISVAKTLYEGLTRIGPDGKAHLAGAQSVSISPDRLCYVFKLRDTKWSNGSPVTAFQYEQAWKMGLLPTSSCPRADLLYMIKNGRAAKKGLVSIDEVGVRAVDAKTLEVKLEYPSPFFLELAAQPICAPLFNIQEIEPTTFNGPFLVASWKKEDLLRLTPNPHFWNKKEVELKQIDIFTIQDIMSAVYLYEKGELDWVGAPLCTLTAELVNRFKDSGTLLSHPIDRAFWVFLNTEDPSLASSKIRCALSLALDRNAITQHILVAGSPLSKPLPPRLLPIKQLPSTQKDINAARELFNEGLEELGFTQETLPPLVITYSQQANRKQLAEYLQETWNQAFGIKVAVRSEEWNVLRTNLAKGLFQICGAFEASFYNDPLELLERFGTINACNFPQWVSSTFCEHISLAMKEKEPARRSEFLGLAEQVLLSEMPFIPISTDTLLFAHLPGLTGYAFDSVGAVDFAYARLINGEEKR